jgi:hypothetical protein
MRRRGSKPALLIFAIAVFAAAASSISIAMAAQAKHGVRSLAPKDNEGQACAKDPDDISRGRRARRTGADGSTPSRPRSSPSPSTT